MTDARLLPTVVGLLTIPLLPLLDKPIEHALEYAFGRVWPLPPRPLGAPASRRSHRSITQPERALHLQVVTPAMHAVLEANAKATSHHA